MMANKASGDFQAFLDSQQYTKNGILRYEKIFGRTYVSTGGQETTKKFADRLNLQQDQRVLDIGCGIGGSAFNFARQHGAHVYGVDLSTNMIEIANGYRNEMEPRVQHSVQFHIDDVTTMKYPGQFYDVVYSRDTILHIEDKLQLFKNFYATLKPGGLLLITDYCRGDRNHDQDFKDYVKQRGYHLLTVKEYGKTLETAGFSNVEAVDNTDYFLEILKTEMGKFQEIKKEMIKEYSLQDFEYICKGWEDKVVRCKKGDQAWGYFFARKLYN